MTNEKRAERAIIKGMKRKVANSGKQIMKSFHELAVFGPTKGLKD